MVPTLQSDRLLLRAWQLDDVVAASRIYGSEDVARWLSPVMDRVGDLAAMTLVLQQWVAEADRLPPPSGRWAIARQDDGAVVGGAVLLPLPPAGMELEMGWQLHPDVWGQGFATETARTLARWAFDQDAAELLALVRPRNTRAAGVTKRLGMDWVGETEKYHQLRLQVYRLRRGDFDLAERFAQH